MAGIEYSAHAPINFSGREAPSRKLNAELAWSSIYVALNRRLLRRTSDPYGRRSRSGRAHRQLRYPTPRGPTCSAATSRPTRATDHARLRSAHAHHEMQSRLAYPRAPALWPPTPAEIAEERQRM